MAYTNAILDFIEAVVIVGAIIKFNKQKQQKKGVLNKLKRCFVKRKICN